MSAITVAYQDIMEPTQIPPEAVEPEPATFERVWPELALEYAEFEPDPDVVAGVAFILAWMLSLLLLGQWSSSGWDRCFQDWQWWCNFQGL